MLGQKIVDDRRRRIERVEMRRAVPEVPVRENESKDADLGVCIFLIRLAAARKIETFKECPPHFRHRIGVLLPTALKLFQNG
jgi:hypothetical protein